MKDESHQRNPWLGRICWALGFVLIGIALDCSKLNPNCQDSPGYIEPAKALLATGEYPSFVRPPGYPVFLAGHLALFGNHGLPVSVWTQRLLWLMCVLFLFPVPNPGDRRAVWVGRVGTALALLMPQVLVNYSLYLSDGLFTVFICLGLFFARRMIRAVNLLDASTAGICIGLATLTRPVAILLPLTLGLIILLCRFLKQTPLRFDTIKAVLVLICISSLFPLGWTIRNRLQSGHFTFSPLTGYNLALHNLPTLRELDEKQAYPKGTPEAEFCRVAVSSSNIPTALDHIRRIFKFDVFEADGVAKRVAVAAIERHPARYLKNTLVYSLRIFIAPSDGLDLMTAFAGQKAWLITPLGEALHQRLWPALAAHVILRLVYFVFLIFIPAWLLWRWFRAHGFFDPELGVMLAAMVYFVLFSAAFIPTNGRFLLPIFPTLYYLYTGALRGTAPQLMPFSGRSR